MDYLIISFYQPPVRQAGRIKVAPPILRNTVLERTPSRGEHILVYQSCSIFPKFAPFLKASGRRCIVYGYNEDRVEGNLTFRKFSEPGLLDDLASCNYVICGGGHTLISEALYYGKPILSLPVKLAFEQYINAMYVEKLGYGINRDMLNLYPGMIERFEEDLETYRETIAKVNFRGNEEVYASIEYFLRNHKLDC